MTKVKKRDTSFTTGPIFIKILMFALPIILTSVLQTFYNIADHMIVGKFSGDANALGSIGNTTALTALMTNLLLGCSSGTGVVIAQTNGAKRYDELSRAVHTAISLSIIGGVLFSVLGLSLSGPALRLMRVKSQFLAGAVLYFRIICIGVPALSVYNFGAAIMRSMGDSKTPLIILSSTGAVNVLLNLLFVIVFNMSLEGVAIATIVAQYLSAIAVIFVLIKRKDEVYALRPKNLRVHKKQMLRILRFGIPAGIQSCFFSFSNVLMTSALNQLTDPVINAKPISNDFDAVAYSIASSFNYAALAAVGQNFGAKQPKRILKTFFYSLILGVGSLIIFSQTVLLFDKQLVSFFIDSSIENVKDVSAAAELLMHTILPLYFICAIMEAFSGTLRGMGYSIFPMISSLISTCLLRAVWVFFVFPIDKYHNPNALYTVYPLSWGITSVFLAGLLVFALIKLFRQCKKEKQEQEENKENCASTESA